MNVMILQQAEREAQRVQANREELIERIGRAMHEDGTIQPLQGLHLSRCSLPFKPVHSVVEPSVYVIAQGSKEVLLGESRYRYGPSQYLLVTVELPRVSQVVSASNEQPYLSLRLGLAPTVVSSQDFDQPLHIEGLARELGVSVSGFYHHFKAITAMSPLQFQKRLRLQEARRLMLGEDRERRVQPIA